MPGAHYIPCLKFRVRLGVLQAGQDLLTDNTLVRDSQSTKDCLAVFKVRAASYDPHSSLLQQRNIRNPR